MIILKKFVDLLYSMISFHDPKFSFEHSFLEKFDVKSNEQIKFIYHYRKCIQGQKLFFQEKSVSRI